MTKSLTTDAQSEISTQQGTAPQYILKVDWGGGIGIKYYGTKSYTIGTITVDGRISSMGDFNYQTSVNGSTTTINLTFTLLDSDLILKGYLDEVVPENRDCLVYLHFEGLLESDLVTLAKGRIASPVVWEENNRTLSFEFLGDIKSNGAGYIIQDGDGDDDVIGKQVPLCFGTPINVPAVRLNASASGTLRYMIDEKNPTFYVIDGDKFPQDTEIDILLDRECVRGIFGAESNTELFTVKANDDLYEYPYGSFSIVAGVTSEYRNIVKYEEVGFTNRVVTDDDYTNANVAWLSDPNKIILGLEVVFYEHTPTFHANYTFTKKHVNKCIKQIGSKVWFWSPWWDDDGAELLINKEYTAKYVAMYFRMAQWFGYFSAGARVRLKDTTGIVYLVNSIPSTSVLRVQAKKNFEDVNNTTVTEVVDVPSNYYTVNLSDTTTIPGQTLTTISLEEELSWKDPAWQDEIYVSLVSTEGPNTADVIQYILETYTDYVIDATSFALAKIDLTNYPSHFAVLEANDALDLSNRIAMEARCSLYFIGNTAYLRYLSKEPTTGSLSLGDSNIEELSVALMNTPEVEELQTRIKGTHYESYSDEEVKETVVENNISVYGLLESDYHFLIYQNGDSVAKTLAFWINRNSNLWRMLQLGSFMNAVKADITDMVNIDTDLLSFSPVKSIVETINITNRQILMNLWLPVLAGTAVVSSLAWLTDSSDTPPADPSVNIVAGGYETLVANIRIQSSWNKETYIAPCKITELLGGVLYLVDVYRNGYAEDSTATLQATTAVGGVVFAVDDNCFIVVELDGNYLIHSGITKLDTGTTSPTTVVDEANNEASLNNALEVKDVGAGVYEPTLNGNIKMTVT